MKQRKIRVLAVALISSILFLVTLIGAGKLFLFESLEEAALARGRDEFSRLFTEERHLWESRLDHGQTAARILGAVFSGPRSDAGLNLERDGQSGRLLMDAAEGQGMGIFVSDVSRSGADLARLAAHAAALQPQMSALGSRITAVHFVSRDNWIACIPGEWVRQVEVGHDLREDLFYRLAAPENTPRQLPVITPLYFDDIWNGWVVSILFPVTAAGEFRGVLGVTVKIDIWITDARAANHIREGRMFLTDSHLQPTLHRDLLPLYQRRDFQLNDVFPFSDRVRDRTTREILARLEPGAFDVRVMTLAGHTRMVVGSARMPRLGWYYVCNRDLNELGAGMRGAAWRFLLIASILVVGVNLLLFLFFGLTVLRPVRRVIGHLKGFRDREGADDDAAPAHFIPLLGELQSSIHRVFGRLTAQVKEIEESKEYVETLMRTIQVFIVVLDRRLRPIYINDYALKKLRIDKQRMTDLRIFEFVDRSFVRRLGQLLRETDNVLNSETRLRLANGRAIDVEVSVSKLFNTTDGWIGYIAVVDDITKRKKAEMNLRNQISFTRQIFKAIPDMILIVDRELKVVFNNEKAEALLEGVAPGDRTITGLLSEKSLEVGFDESLRNIIRNGETIKQINVMNPFSEGFHSVDLLIEPIQTVTGIIGAVIIIRDISEWRNLTEKIKSLQEFLGRLIDASPFGIVSINEQNQVSVWNKAAERLFQLSGHHVLGKDVFEIHPFFLAYKDTINEVKVLDKSFFMTDQRMDCPGEPFKVLNLNFYPVRSDGQNVVINVEDVSELRRLEDSLLQAQKMESLGLLTSGIIHDFNNILSGIVGYASLLEKKVEGKNELKKYTANIIASGERASGLIRQILDFSRKRLSRKEVLDINQVIDELLGFLSVNLKGVKVVKVFSENHIRLSADRTKISQVMINLIINAKEAMEGIDHPELWVRTEEVLIKGQKDLMDGVYAKISLTDNGLGIADEDREKIFEPFYSTKDKSKSTGLGLAIVRDIVKECQGAIQIDSTPGKGTTFSLLIPSVKEEYYEASPEPASMIQPAIEGAILLIDDEAVIREIGKDMLESMGVGCFTAGNGEEGLALYESHRDEIGMVLLDIEMPGMSGDQVAGALKKIDPDVKILFSSGYTKEYLEAKVFNGKIENFIAKPFHLSQLSETLHRLLKE